LCQFCKLHIEAILLPGVVASGLSVVWDCYYFLFELIVGSEIAWILIYTKSTIQKEVLRKSLNS